MKTQDFDRLSAYIDDQLAPSDKAVLEQRLAREPALRAALSELQRTVLAVRSLPLVKPPRNFTLTPAQVGLRAGRQPQRRAGLFASLRLAASLSAAALVLVIGGDFAATQGLLGRAASPAPEVLFTTTESSNMGAVEQTVVTDTPEENMSILAAPETETPAIISPEAAGGGSDAAPTGEETPAPVMSLLPDAVSATPSAERSAQATPAGETAPDADMTAMGDPYDTGLAELEATDGTKGLPPADATMSVNYGTDGGETSIATAPGLSPLRVIEAALAMLTVLLGLGAWLASRNP